MASMQIARRIGVLIILLIALSACAARWLPDHDPLILNKMVALNEDTMVLFSAVSPSTTTASFARLESSYDKLIGGFEALNMLAKARPVPSLGISGLTRQIADRACAAGATLADCINTTPANIDEIVLTLRTMRDAHKRMGLPADLVEQFRQPYLFSSNSILILEAALKR